MRHSKPSRIKRLTALSLAASVAVLTGCTGSGSGNRSFSAEYGKEIPGRYEALTSDEAEQAAQDASAENLRSFAVESSAKIFPEVEGNYLYSPASLYMALQLCGGLTAEGKADDLMSLLGATDREDLRKQGNALIRMLSSNEKGEVLKVGNSIWVDTVNLPELSPEAEKVIRDTAAPLGADVFHEKLTDPKTKERINSWIASRTENLIKEMLVEPDPTSAMILFNTLYFDKKWKEEISEDQVHSVNFYPGGGNSSVKIDRMDYSLEHHSFIRTEHAVSSAAEYQDGSYMILIKPNTQEDFEAAMTEDLKDIISAYAEKSFTRPEGPYEVLFGIPVVDYEVKMEDLAEAIGKMGVNSLFSPSNGSFSDIDSSLYVSEIAQDCRIIVDREGTKAAAATEIMTLKMAVPEEKEPEIIDLRMERDYGYVIMSKEDIPLFIGAVRDPKK